MTKEELRSLFPRVSEVNQEAEKQDANYGPIVIGFIAGVIWLADYLLKKVEK